MTKYEKQQQKILEAIEAERKKQEIRHKEMALGATLILISGCFLGYLDYHGLGLIVEVTGLLAVAIV
jgi:hypothetical protein